MARNIANFLIFQAAWFITVFSASGGYPYVGVLFTLMWMALHLHFFSRNLLAELNLLVFAAVLGYLVDSLQVQLGVFSFSPHAQFGGPSPLWMVALWVNLAATLNFSLSWLGKKYFLSAALGAVSGPLAYFAGTGLGAMVFESPWSLAAVSLQWFLCMPLLLCLARSGFSPWGKAMTENHAVVSE